MKKKIHFFLLGFLLISAFSVQAQCIPDPPLNLGPDQGICPGDTVDLLISNQYASIQWSTSADDTLNTLSILGPDTVSVTITDSSGCTAADTIIITQSPVPTPDLGNDQNLCEGDTAILDAGPGYFAYLWNDNTTDQDLEVVTSGTFWVRVKNAQNCAGYDTVNVTFHGPPVVTLGNDTSFCDGSILVLDAGTGMNSYQWSTGDTSSMILVDVSGDYWVEVESQYGCPGNSDTVFVTVNPNPSAPSITLTDSMLTATGTGTFTWYRDGQMISGGQNGALNHGYVEGYYQVLLTDANGCDSPFSDSVLVEVVVVDTVFTENNIPELISPNGDNLNDRWVIADLDRFSGNKITILNRWGQEVYSASPYANDFEGKSGEGKVLADGTYYFIVDLGDAAYDPFKGILVIKR